MFYYYDLLPSDKMLYIMNELASCLIYARACVEYVYGCVLFQDVTVREIRGR